MSKVLVLGAGASMAYGYPSGRDLRKLILDFSIGQAKRAGIIRERFESRDSKSFIKFRTSFLHSQMYSVDAFLGKRPEFAEIGKKCIASILLGCEDSEELFSEPTEKDHWYQYLFNQWATNDWDELTFDGLAVITFNYDRSLEHFLYVTLQSAYGKSTGEAAEKLKSLRILHVYGSLSNELPNSKRYLPYDGKVDMDKVMAAAKELIVIPEGRVDSPTLKQAREWLAAAQDIGFLGFGFDTTNVERLAEGGACEVAITRPNAVHVRRLCGTRLGLYDMEMRKAFLALIRGPTHVAMVANFFNANCTDTLRQTLFLDR